jgi:hypothetical protein
VLRIVFQHGHGEYKALEVFKPQHSAPFKMCPRIRPCCSISGKIAPDQNELLWLGRGFNSRIAFTFRKEKTMHLQLRAEEQVVLGFTYYCEQRNGNGGFIAGRITEKGRMAARCKAIKAELERRRDHRTSRLVHGFARLCWAAPNTMLFRGTRQS